MSAAFVTALVAVLAAVAAAQASTAAPSTTPAAPPRPTYARDIAVLLERTTYPDALTKARADGADLLIAATAMEHGLTVVSRNVQHFEPTGVSVLDPFENKS